MARDTLWCVASAGPDIACGRVAEWALTLECTPSPRTLYMCPKCKEEAMDETCPECGVPVAAVRELAFPGIDS